MIELGDEVKDKITGFKGIATSRIKYLNGCDKIGIQPKMGKDGKIPDCIWFDDIQIVLIKKHPQELKYEKPGGPMIKNIRII